MCRDEEDRCDFASKMPPLRRGGRSVRVVRLRTEKEWITYYKNEHALWDAASEEKEDDEINESVEGMYAAASVHKGPARSRVRSPLRSPPRSPLRSPPRSPLPTFSDEEEEEEPSRGHIMRFAGSDRLRSAYATVRNPPLTGRRVEMSPEMSDRLSSAILCPSGARRAWEDNVDDDVVRQPPVEIPPLAEDEEDDVIPRGGVIKRFTSTWNDMYFSSLSCYAHLNAREYLRRRLAELNSPHIPTAVPGVGSTIDVSEENLGVDDFSWHADFDTLD
jgi:hypothetical protein